MRGVSIVIVYYKPIGIAVYTRIVYPIACIQCVLVRCTLEESGGSDRYARC